MTIAIRRAQISDIPEALQLCRAAGWNQLESDWRRLYAFEPDGCFSAESHGDLVGTVTTTCYGRRLAWIGMMLVHQDYRRQGIATRLMNRALQYLHEREIQCTMLDATPEGSYVYQKLGFVEEFPIQRWRRHATLSTESSVTAAEAISTNDSVSIETAQALRQLDCEAFGADRWDWIDELIPGSVVRCHGKAMGMLRPGYLASYLGPLIASDTQDDVRAVAAELIQSTTEPIFWDIPVPNEIAAELATDLKFKVVRKLIRMRLGSANVDSDSRRLFALADPSAG